MLNKPNTQPTQFWSISTTTTRPGDSPPEHSLFVSWPQATHCIFSLFIFAGATNDITASKQASTHTIHRHFPLCTRRDDDAYDNAERKVSFPNIFVLHAYHDGCTRLTILWNLHERPFSPRQRPKSLVICISRLASRRGQEILRSWRGSRSSVRVSNPNCPYTEPTATTSSFLLLSLCLVRGEQSCDPELKWYTQSTSSAVHLGALPTSTCDLFPSCSHTHWHSTIRSAWTRVAGACSGRVLGPPRRPPGGGTHPPAPLCL